jgi:acyl-CoA reductase-like NAD-dependent aldehyde dehydrogenase
MLALPLLRKGKAYTSLDTVKVPHYRTGAPVADLSLANPGLVRRDLQPESQKAMREALAGIQVKDLVAMSARAADLFMNGLLPCGDTTQSVDEYVKATSGTTGLPYALVRRNMTKISGVMANVKDILSGLMRGLPLDVLDTGVSSAGGSAVSFTARGSSLGVVLPSNSPGVHSLWAPSIALKIPLILKPGSAEPFTPLRIIQAFMAAGVPPEAFAYLPSSHAGAEEILRRCGRGMVFGDTGSTAKWLTDSRIEVHGPGYSKVVLGPDASRDFHKHIDTIVASIAENSGRSCVNASGVWVTSHAKEIARAIAERLAQIVPRLEDDPLAALAPFANARVAEYFSRAVDAGLEHGGAEDVTASLRDGSRLAVFEGSTYLLPTLVRCDSPAHALANREFLFPFASVVEVKPEDLPEILGPSLAVALITEDEDLKNRFLARSSAHRLNLGSIPTPHIGWDQPHEGNLFEHLYSRRAIQFQKAS